MTKSSSSRGRLWAGVAVTVAAFSIVAYFSRFAVADDAASAPGGRAAQLTSLKLKFDGAQSCGGSGCHKEAAEKPGPGPFQTEMVTWDEKDQHSKAFAHLKKPWDVVAEKHPEVKDIAKKLKIKKATSSERCLTCHALNVPDELQGENFDIAEGVSCDFCHGPSQNWRKPHSQKDWTNQQRATAQSAAGGDWPGQAAHAQLLKTLGLYDTKPLIARAEICVSCHLKIDGDMVAAGHPQPFFELNYFEETEPKHWREKPEHAGINHLKVWAAGQIVCLREAAQQASDRAKASDPAVKDSVDQTLAHWHMVKALSDAGAFPLPADAAAGADKLRADPAAGAAALIAAYKAIAPAVVDLKPDAAMASKVAAAIAKDPAFAELGRPGAQQQAMALWSLTTATNGGTAAPDVQALIKAAGATPDADFQLDDYKKALAAVKLP
jgi:hypothetical protein